MRKDITGQTFGEWTAISRVNTEGGPSKWLCRCSCGIEREVNQYNLTTGRSLSCGHVKGASRRDDITGQTFGKLTALARVGRSLGGNNSIWHCRCACGNEVDVAMGNLKNGHTTSCGCVRAAAQQDPRKRMEAKALSPLTGKFETNVHAKYFELEYQGTRYQVRNLLNFVREHLPLFGLSDEEAAMRTARGLYDAGQRGYRWHGWTVRRIELESDTP